MAGLIIPGGESTTISKGIERDDLAGAIEEAAGSGMPVLGTCAGMILLGNSHLGLIDIETRRNAFGRQLASFEADIEIPALVGEDPIRAVFIRAPWVEQTGKGVEVLAEVEGHPSEKRMKFAFDELRFFSKSLKILGVYPAHPFRFQNRLLSDD